MAVVDVSGLRFALPMVQGRGAGLGNEMIVWAKAFVASQALGLQLLHPAWGLNPRRYYRYFGTSRLDWIGHRALRTGLPFVVFGEDDYIARGGGDLETALRSFAADRRLEKRGAFVLGLTGMWGGMDILRGARDFLRSRLLSARGTLGNLYEVDRRCDPERLRIALHVRRGDFGETLPIEAYRGRFNTAIALDWYIAVARTLQIELGRAVQFLIISDAGREELEPLLRSFDCVMTDDLPDRDISDMLALADSDFIVCSISSYSLWATFFSSARYAWFAPNLSDHGGFGSIWGHEAGQIRSGSPTLLGLREAERLLANGEMIRPRGVAVGMEAHLSDELLTDLMQRHAAKRRATDLTRFGVTPLAG